MRTDVDLWAAPRVGRPVAAVVSLPGSKSITNRALVLAALADGPSVVRRALRSRDTLLMAAAVSALGSAVDTTGQDWTVRPGRIDTGGRVDSGLAGTVARFVPPVAGLSRGDVVFDGDPRMRLRPVGPMLTALRSLGVQVADDGRGALPFTVRGRGSVPGGPVVLDASESSQFVSGLLLAGARFDRGVDVRHRGPTLPSRPHVAMTVAMLREHGVNVDDGPEDRWTVRPGPLRPVDRWIEPDLSNAAPFLALAAVAGGTVTVRDWPAVTTQAGDAMREILSLMGCRVARHPDGLTVTGTGSVQGLDLDLGDVGELVPVVAALCALADTPSRLRGVGHVRGHETDRLAALAAGLAGLGADVTERPDGLAVRPARLHGGVWRTYADHRMAQAGAVLGAAVDGVLVEDVATAAKTFPDFAAVWSELL